MTTISLNGTTVIGMRLWMPWKGSWIADVDLDPSAVALAPTSGPAVILVGTATLKGTVDPRGSGSFVSTARCRVVGGAAGWDKHVAALDFHNDAQILSTQVYTATGALVGEAVTDLAPKPLGIDFARAAGPASAVFGEADWWVDPLGITFVGTRLPAIPDPTLQVMTWEPMSLRADVVCDTLVLPGTPLLDARIGGSPVAVRDVEQTFSSKGGSRATVFVSTNPVSRLTNALTQFVRKAAKVPYLRVYRYRIVSQSPADGRVILQAVNPTAGMPDMFPLSLWPGMSGDSAKLLPSSEVLVEFLEGDPTKPFVRGFSSSALPLERTIDASVAVKVGPTAPLVSLADGTTPLALAPYVVAFEQAISTWAASFGGPPSAVTSTQIFALVAALTTALGLIPPATTKTVAA